jgi:predicted small secreted protein
MKRLAVLMLAVWAFALAGCNTVHGIGKDVEKAGEAIQDDPVTWKIHTQGRTGCAVIARTWTPTRSFPNSS